MRRFAILLPALIACLVYLPSLSFDRTLDDFMHVPPPGQKVTDSLTFAWTHPYWNRDYAGSGLYRPVTSSTFRLESKLGTPLWARHLFNVLLYGSVSGLLVGLSFVLGFGLWPCLVAGILFALHPTHVEVVAGLVGRAELLAALFMLMALHLHHRILHRSGRFWIWLLGSAVFAFLAAGSKESAWGLAVLALPLHVAAKKPLRTGTPAFIGYAIGLFAHLLLRHHVLGGWVNAPGVVISPEDNPLVLLHGSERALGGLRVAGAFLLHLILPHRLSPDYSGTTVSISGHALDPLLLGGCFLMVGILTLLFVGWRIRTSLRGVAFLVAGIWVGSAFVLTMNVFFNLGTILADRLLFWASAGWSLLLAAVLVRSNGQTRSRFTIPALLLALLILGVYGKTTVSYLPHWKDNLTLFDYERQVAPNSARAWAAYGRSLENANRPEDALDALHKSQQLAPDFQLAWSLEAAYLMELGRFEEAKAPLAEARRLNPGDPISRENEAVIWFHEGRFKDAIPRFREALARNPQHGGAAKYLAQSLEQEGTPAEAEVAWRLYLKLNPQDPEGLASLGLILVTKPGGVEEAKTLVQRALTLSPDFFQLHDILAKAFVQSGQFADAAREWRMYLKASPDDPSVLNDLAWILATQLGVPADGEELARRAVQLSPQNPTYLDTLAECLEREGKTAEAARVARHALTLPGAAPDLRRFLR